MNTRRPIVGALAANVALLALVVGVPVALVAAIGSPLPHTLPDWTQLSTALTRGEVTDRTLLKIVAGAIWLAWLQIAATVLNEIAATARGVTSRPIPFSSTSVQLGVGRLVATAALLFASLHQPAVRPVASLPRPVLAAHVTDTVPLTTEVSADVQTGPAVREWVVAPRETLWGIAERVLGDGRAYTQLLALNHGRPQPDGTAFTDPHHLQPGTRLLLPPAASAHPPTSVVHHVTPGDTLSAIAHDELHDPGRWPELFDLNRGHPQPDGLHLTDPDLLRPGWTLQLPETPTAPPSEAPATETVASPPSPATTPPTTWRSDTTSPHVAQRAAEVETPRDDQDSPSLAEEIGWTGGAILSGGLLLLAARLRRRHRQPLEALRRPSRRIRDIDLALRATSRGDAHLASASGTLRQLSIDLRHHRLDGSEPHIVELGPEHIEVLWTQPLLPTAGAWTSTDGGWSWTLPTGLPLNVDAMAPCPALVTIGSRDTNPVLVNLEALGTLAVRGDGAADLLNAIVLELATTPFADVLTVITCGLPEPHRQLERIRAMPFPDAVGWARSHVPADEGTSPSFAHRVRARTEPHEPLVVVCGDIDVNDHDYRTLLELAQPGSGIVLVSLEPPIRADEWCLHIDGSTVTLEPLGLQLAARTVTARGVSAITELLDDIDRDGDDTADGEQPEDAVQVTIIAAWHDPHEDPQDDLTTGQAKGTDDFTDAPCDLELRLFGQVDLGATDIKLTPGELELLAYLHCHPEGTTADLIRTALWPDGRAAKTLHNRMSGLRNKLGLDADGQPLLPHSNDDRYRLSPRVTSDWRRALTRIQHADTIPSIDAMALLRDALELVTGPPFVATTGYSWAYSEGLATEMTEVIKHAARHLAELALDANDATGAIWAARRGQLVTTPADSQQLTLIAMRAHAELGNPAAAVAAYRELLADLDELDPELEPAPDVSATYDAIRRARAS